MTDNIFFPPKKEHTLQLENVTLRMLTYPIHSKSDQSVRLYALHTHAHDELFACLEGSFHLQTESGLLTVNEGDIVIVPPDFPHHKLPTSDGTKWCCLDFVCVGRRRANTIDLRKQLSALCNSKQLLIAHNEPALCREIAKAADMLESEGSVLPALRLITVLTELSEKPLQRIAAGDTLHAPTPETMELTDINRLSRLDYLINGCFVDPTLTLSRAAKLLYISERQLERIMRKEYGGSFHHVLTEKRLETAASMLTETDLAVEQISSDTGFPSKATFARAFQKKYGETPTRYRELHRVPPQR